MITHLSDLKNCGFPFKMEQLRSKHLGNNARFCRHRQLLEILNEKGGVRTAEIAGILKVTEETVRRDFATLEKEGVLLRSHGGAIPRDLQRRERPVNDRTALNSAAKRAIAQTAVRWIEPDQNVFLDSSTTAQQLAQIIQDQPLTVLTTSLKIPDLFSAKPAVEVIVLGGHFRASSKSCVGFPAEMISNLYRIDAAFLSCRGIDLQGGLSEATEEQARLKRHLLNRVSYLYLLADSSKANISAAHYFAKHSQIDIWFTEAEPGANLAAQLKMQGVKIEVCPGQL